MLFETVITSAQRGIRSGRTGFQPVMRTGSLRDDVLQQLESLAAYRHVHAQGSGNNPECFVFRRLRSNIGELFAISRTVDAGNDYSNRSNKCSHIVAFTKDEVARFSGSSPASIILDNMAAFSSQWRGDPETRSAEPKLVGMQHPSEVCGLWHKAFGDAGCAGVVAERVRSGQPTLLIAPDCSPKSSRFLLGLFSEVIALLNPQERWGATFETTILGASQSLLQGTYRQSPEAEVEQPGLLRLEVGVKQVIPQEFTGSPLVQLAREGRQEPTGQKAPVPSGSANVPPLPTEHAGSPQFIDRLPPPSPGAVRPPAAPRRRSRTAQVPAGTLGGQTPEAKTLLQKNIFLLVGTVLLVIAAAGWSLWKPAAEFIQDIVKKGEEWKAVLEDGVPKKKKEDGQGEGDGTPTAGGNDEEGRLAATGEMEAGVDEEASNGNGASDEKERTNTSESGNSGSAIDVEALASEKHKKEKEEQEKIWKILRTKIAEKGKGTGNSAVEAAKPVTIVGGVKDIAKLKSELVIEFAKLTATSEPFCSIDDAWKCRYREDVLGQFEVADDSLKFKAFLESGKELSVEQRLMSVMPFTIKRKGSADRTAYVTLKDCGFGDGKKKVFSLQWGNEPLSFADFLEESTVKLSVHGNDKEFLEFTQPDIQVACGMRSREITNKKKKTELKFVEVGLSVNQNKIFLSLRRGKGEQGKDLVEPLAEPLVVKLAAPDVLEISTVSSDSLLGKLKRWKGGRLPSADQLEVTELVLYIDLINKLEEEDSDFWRLFTLTLRAYFGSFILGVIEADIVSYSEQGENAKELSRPESVLWNLREMESLKEDALFSRGREIYGKDYQKLVQQWRKSKGGTGPEAFLLKQYHGERVKEALDRKRNSAEKIRFADNDPATGKPAELSWKKVFRWRLCSALFYLDDEKAFSLAYSDKITTFSGKPEEKRRQEKHNNDRDAAILKREAWFAKSDLELLRKLGKLHEKLEQFLIQDNKRKVSRKNGLPDLAADQETKRADFEREMHMLVGCLAGHLYFNLRPAYIWVFASDALISTDSKKKDGLLQEPLSRMLQAKLFLGVELLKKDEPEEYEKKEIEIGEIVPGPVEQKPKATTEVDKPVAEST